MEDKIKQLEKALLELIARVENLEFQLKQVDIDEEIRELQNRVSFDDLDHY